MLCETCLTHEEYSMYSIVEEEKKSNEKLNDPTINSSIVKEVYGVDPSQLTLSAKEKLVCNLLMKDKNLSAEGMQHVKIEEILNYPQKEKLSPSHTKKSS